MTSSDEQAWRDAISIANIPTLLPLLVQLTGDMRWLDDRYRPSRTRGLSDNDTAGLPDDVQAEIRAAAADAVLAWRTSGTVALPNPEPDLLVRLLGFSLGEPIPPEYGPMLADEVRKVSLSVLDPTKADPTTPDPTKADPTAGNSAIPTDAPIHTPTDGPIAPPTGLRAIIIGAGMSGMCASIELAKAGIGHVILERNETVGGTWIENRYPGCGVDVPSHLYCYSFAPHEWKRYFALRPEIHEYFEHVADTYGIRPRVQFTTTVESAEWDATAAEWVVTTRPSGSPDTGPVTVHRANILISAVGAFNKPRKPDLPGIDSFEGQSLHTGMWPKEEVDLAGRRVAVIGNGASAMQLVPAIAGQVEELHVFQRSPHWASPFEKFQVEVPEPIRFLIREMPLYYVWYRLRLSWAFNDKSHAALQKDPSWPHPERSLNPVNEAHRVMLTRYMEEELGDRTDLLEAVVPTYPPFGKRLLLDNGWYRTLRRPNVHLRADPVASVHPRHVTTVGGEEIEVDTIIWAIGFDVLHFLAPMSIRGRLGTTIHEEWHGDDAKAFMGTAVPGFPNFFCLYGPNTQFGHGGSLIFVIERQIHYVMSVLRAMTDRGASAVEVRSDVHDEYNKRVDNAHENMVWTHKGMDTYYRNSKGRVVVNNPFRIVDVWNMTQRADPDDYVFTSVDVTR